MAILPPSMRVSTRIAVPLGQLWFGRPAADRHRLDGQQRVAVVGRLAIRMPPAQYHRSIGGFVMAESEAFLGAERRTP